MTHTIELVQCLAELCLVLIRQGVDILLLIREAVGAPHQRALELAGPPSRDSSRQPARLDALLGPGKVLLLVDLVCDVGILAHSLLLSLLGPDPVNLEPGTKALGVVVGGRLGRFVVGSHCCCGDCVGDVELGA